MKLIIRLILNTIAVLLAAYVVSGVIVSSVLAALTFAIVLTAINLLIRPFIILFTLPINILTLGLFTLVINGLMVELAAAVVPGFHVFGLWPAMIFAIILWLINWFFESMVKTSLSKERQSID